MILFVILVHIKVEIEAHSKLEALNILGNLQELVIQLLICTTKSQQIRVIRNYDPATDSILY